MFSSRSSSQKNQTSYNYDYMEVIDIPWFKELIITFQDNQRMKFDFFWTKSGAANTVSENEPGADWTKLDFHKCDCCPLNDDVQCCPAAEMLEHTLMKLQGHKSNEMVTATAIDVAKRETAVSWQLREVGSTFVQVAVFFSGCPIGKQFRVMLKNLRSFSTNHEIGKHLITQYLLKHRGEIFDSKREIREKLEPLRRVFHFLSKRLFDESRGDAIVDSIVQLDAFTLSVELIMEDVYNEISSELEWEQ